VSHTLRSARPTLVWASTFLAVACSSSERTPERRTRDADAASAADLNDGEDDDLPVLVVGGTVVDARGAPVAAAAVAGFDASADAGWTSYPPGPDAPSALVRWVRLETTSTDRAGRFRLRLPRGSSSVKIAARKDGDGEATAEFDVSDAANVSLRLVLVPDGAVRGVLRRPDGAPAADADISCRARSSDHPLGEFVAERRTDGDGAFRFENVPAGPVRLDTTSPDFDVEICGGRCEIVAGPPGFLAEEDAVVDVAPGELRVLDLRVRAYADVRGRVLLPDGASAGGTLVVAIETDASDGDAAATPSAEDPLMRTYADGGGGFNFPTLRPGRRYRIFAGYDPSLLKEDLAPAPREAIKSRLLDRVQPGARYASAETRPAAGENPPFTLHLK